MWLGLYFTLGALLLPTSLRHPSSPSTHFSPFSLPPQPRNRSFSGSGAWRALSIALPSLGMFSPVWASQPSLPISSICGSGINMQVPCTTTLSRFEFSGSGGELREVHSQTLSTGDSDAGLDWQTARLSCQVSLTWDYMTKRWKDAFRVAVLILWKELMCSGGLLGIFFPSFMEVDIIDTYHCISLRHTMWWFDVCICCEISTKARLVNKSIPSHSYHFRTVCGEDI